MVLLGFDTNCGLYTEEIHCIGIYNDVKGTYSNENKSIMKVKFINLDLTII